MNEEARTIVEIVSLKRELHAIVRRIHKRPDANPTPYERARIVELRAALARVRNGGYV